METPRAEEVGASIRRIEQALSNYTGGFSIPRAVEEIGKEINFIDNHLTFARFEISKLRNSVDLLFGKKRRRCDVEAEKRYARAECHSLRGKTREL